MTEQASPESIFEQALQCTDQEERTICLEEACGGNEELRREVESLLAAHQAAGSFLEPIISPEPVTPGEQEGDQIGHYKLLELIGEGGFGRVWMAEQTEPVQRRVALKIVKLGMDTGEVLARFEAERQALALMEHPNIAQVFDGGATDSGRPYFVMELVRGVPITDYCDANKLPPRPRIELFEKVCRAVQHAHQKGIIHRDLKPSNILVTVQDDKPVPKVIDFGVAKALQKRLTERTLFTRMNQWVGTPEYMSPEQAGLGSHDVDTRSDVYSLGVVLYELLTGRTPFGGRELREEGYEAMLCTIREEDPPKPSTRLSSLPHEDLRSVADHRGRSPERLGREVRGEVEWILLKALERDRSRRYATANALAIDLGRYSAGDAICAAPPSIAYRTKKHVRKHPGQTAALTGLALLLAAAASAVTWWMLRPGPQPFERTGMPLLTTLVGHKDIVSSLAYSPQHHMLASASYDGSIKLWDPENGELVTTLRDHGDRIWGIALSPDHNVLASAGCDRRILLWDLRRKKLRGVFKEGATPTYHNEKPGHVENIYFSPDGKLLAACSAEQSSINLWEVDTGKLYRRLDLRTPKRFRFSPDGSKIAAAGSGGSLVLWDVKTGQLIWSQRRDGHPVTALAFSPDGQMLAIGDTGHNICLCGVATGKMVARFPKPGSTGAASLWSVVFAPDGETLASASAGTIWLWDVDSRRELAQLRGFGGRSCNLVFLREGRILVSVTNEREIKIWDAEAAVDPARFLPVVTPANDARAPLIFAYDSFDHDLSLDWSILNPSESHFSFKKKTGSLTITTQNGSIYGTSADAKNLFLLSNPVTDGGDFTVTTCVEKFKPELCWTQSGLLCFDDKDHYIKWYYGVGNGAGFRELMLLTENQGAFQRLYIPYHQEPDRLWLRITKSGNRYIASFSNDGTTFRVVGDRLWGNGSPRKLGLFAKNGNNSIATEIDASFAFFEIREPMPTEIVPQSQLSGQNSGVIRTP